jgi:hypothetical protein
MAQLLRRRRKAQVLGHEIVIHQGRNNLARVPDGMLNEVAVGSWWRLPHI